MDPQFTEIERRWEALRDLEAGEDKPEGEDLFLQAMEALRVKRLERGAE